MIARGGTERMSARSSTEGEVIPGKVLMSCLTVTIDQGEVGDEELTVMLKVPAA
jgi:hypothetical protein